MDVQVDAGSAGGGEIVAPISQPIEGAINVRQAAEALKAARDAAPDQAAQERSEAARKLSQAGWEKRRQQAQAVEQPAPVEPQELSGEDNAAPPEAEATGETQENDPAELPPLDPPRSWSQEARERWSKLDRDTQQYLLDHDSNTSASVRKAQNEAAEQRKAMEAKAQQAEQVRQQYEAALPILMQQLQQGGAEFADIKSMADLQKMAAEDPARYLRWDAYQKQVSAVSQEIQAVQKRQESELSQRWNEFSSEQDRLISEKAPELGDPVKAPQIRENAAKYLRDLGFADQEMADAYNGQRGVSLRDHRIQLAILDAMKWREAQAKAKQVTAAPKPPVQRPGTGQPKGAHLDTQISALEGKLKTAKGVDAIKIATQLQQLKRQASAR